MSLLNMSITILAVLEGYFGLFAIRIAATSVVRIHFNKIDFINLRIVLTEAHLSFQEDHFGIH